MGERQQVGSHVDSRVHVAAGETLRSNQGAEGRQRRQGQALGTPAGSNTARNLFS